ncbi:helix-turn-helix domain-containing protein [Pectobacterium aroidearum]|uniref:helix-turn-helix domain-containing protein n=1 Tax=Pectobacterium aroidearum TaxID=1201031 RepID=UPI0015DFA68C|nr:helix-turn-helix domain-containing protein [Pectobacterium aroidearum]MBA0204406.1 helix-turn-helix domain-containing protein [Pectobacterium aroidearum]
MQIGDRLRQERERLSLTQTAMAKICGVAFRTYCDYEAGKTEPKASFFNELNNAGGDSWYVLTGKYMPNIGDVSNDELELIKIYRAAPLAIKVAALAALTAGSSATASINVTGSGQRVAGRDYHEGKK